MKKTAAGMLLFLLAAAICASGAETVLSVVKGGTGLAAIANHQLAVGTGTNTYTAKTVPDCPDSAGNHVNFTQSTNAFSCGTSGATSGTVTTTGSPASGNLTKFSGSTSVTNGDLSGDVTTSGTLATTLANSGVSAGSCGDATHSCSITVDAKGRVTSQSNNSITATTTIASGSKALGTSAIASGACATTVTDTATGTASTDNIQADFNADPTSTTGYIPAAMLTIVKWPTTNTVNFKVCNNTGSSITPSAVTLNWRVVR